MDRKRSTFRRETNITLALGERDAGDAWWKRVEEKRGGRGQGCWGECGHGRREMLDELGKGCLKWPGHCGVEEMLGESRGGCWYTRDAG